LTTKITQKSAQEHEVNNQRIDMDCKDLELEH